MSNNSELYDMKRAAELVGIGRNTLIKFLKETKVLNPDRLPYFKFQQLGYFKLHTSVYTHAIHGEMARNKTMVTPRGIEFISHLLNTHFDKPERSGTDG